MSTQNTNNEFCNIYNQRKLIAVNNIPLPRSEIVSPYPNFTQYQLDMRRKTEILKYKDQPSKVKTYTKKINFSRIMQGLNQNIPQTTNALNCINNEFVPTPSYKSGIPGPNITLLKNPNVPLYNYNGILNKNVVSQSDLSIIYSPKQIWNYYTTNNIITNQAISNKIFTLTMSESINKPYYIFSFSTPVGIYIDGSYNSNTWVRYSIISASLDVYYQGNIVQVNKLHYQSSLNNLPYNLDISFVYLNYNYNNTSSNTPLYFQACQFVGNLSFSNIFLYSQPGYVYDFYLTLIIKQKMIYGTIYNNIKINKYYTICNFTDDLFINNNCTTTNSIPGLTAMPFIVNTT